MPVCGGRPRRTWGRPRCRSGGRAGQGRCHAISSFGCVRGQVDLDAFGLGDEAADDVGEHGGLERQAAHLVVADDVDEVLRAQQQRELAEVHLGDQHLVVAREDVAEVLGERVEVTQVRLRDLVAGLAHAAHACADRAVRRTPAEHEHLGRWPSGPRVVDRERRQRVGDPVDLGLAGADHEVVVARVVGDVAVPVALLEAADAVLEAGRAGDGPRAGQRLGVARVGPELGVLALRRGWARWRSRGRSWAGRRPRGSATARSRWRGSRRRAASPACDR